MCDSTVGGSFKGCGGDAAGAQQAGRLAVEMFSPLYGTWGLSRCCTSKGVSWGKRLSPVVFLMPNLIRDIGTG